MNEIQELFIFILTVISDAITSLVSLLPNPDPFPEIIESMSITPNDAVATAWFWIDQFFVADMVLSVFGAWIIMFPIAWIIMIFWRWLKSL